MLIKKKLLFVNYASPVVKPEMELWKTTNSKGTKFDLVKSWYSNAKKYQIIFNSNTLCICGNMIEEELKTLVKEK